MKFTIPAKMHRGIFAEGLIKELVDRPDPEVESAWATEARRRLDELRSGKAKLIPGDEVSARVRRLVSR